MFEIKLTEKTGDVFDAEVEALLQDICTAVRQLDEGQGFSHQEARSQALARLRA